jgi:hypothetical protein
LKPRPLEALQVPLYYGRQTFAARSRPGPCVMMKPWRWRPLNHFAEGYAIDSSTLA